MPKWQKTKWKYGKLPPKEAVIFPWKYVCVNLIGQYKLKGKDGTVMDFMCLTMIDPAYGWFEFIELTNASVICIQKRKRYLRW